MIKVKQILQKVILFMCCVVLVTGTVHATTPVEKVNYVADNESVDTICQMDEGVIEKYVLSINQSSYEEIASCYCDGRAMEAFFADESNRENHIGIYNVQCVNDYGITELEVSGDYADYADARVYLLWLNCDVVESNQFFMQGDNFFQVVLMTENGKRGFLEFSVASENVIYEAIGNTDFSLTESNIQSYIEKRIEIFKNLSEFEVIKADESSANSMARAEYGPKTLSSYVFPTMIRIYYSPTGTYMSYNFKNYCYVVSACEFGVGTDVEKDVHIEALKAFSLCVRNLGWYRTLYPYDANGAYDIDDYRDQAFDLAMYSQLNSYNDNVTAMDEVWNVMMFDGAKKLFYPAYRSGTYSDFRDTAENLDPDEPYSKFYQNGSNYLATESNYDYKQILHYYYDAALGTIFSSGPIIVCDVHTRSAVYKYNATGHGRECVTCGHITYTAHTMKSYSTYKRCSVCGYMTYNNTVA